MTPMIYNEVEDKKWNNKIKGGSKMKKIFIEAHKMTREMKESYPEVDYQAQFGLCVSYLLEKKEEKQMLKGSEKQVKWAEDIRNEWLEKIKSHGEMYSKRGQEYIDYYSLLEKKVNEIQFAKTFIENRAQGYIYFTKACLGISHPSKRMKVRQRIATEYWEQHGRKDMEKGKIY